MRILYVTTVGSTMGFFEEQFKQLITQGHTVELACSSSWDYSGTIKELNLKRHDIPFSRSPFSKENIKAYRQLKKIIKTGNYDIIHCHTPNAAAIARLSSKSMRKNGLKVIYTAHGFHFYKGAPLKNWLIYFPIEWICSFWTDTLITINKEDYVLAQKLMKAKKVEYIPGVGINLSKFDKPIVSKEEKRREIGIPQDRVVLFSVGELNDNKNHAVVIKAIASIKKNKKLLYLIAGKGENKNYLAGLAKELGLEDQAILLDYRNDISELMIASDIFIFPSYREGLSVSLMEAMASGKPCIVSQIRGNVDLIDNNGGILFDPTSVSECREAIIKGLKSDSIAMGAYNKNKVKKFSTENVISKMDEIYHANL